MKNKQQIFNNKVVFNSPGIFLLQNAPENTNHTLSFRDGDGLMMG